jgi:hypothetical protein
VYLVKKEVIEIPGVFTADSHPRSRGSPDPVTVIEGRIAFVDSSPNFSRAL